jgi:TetR/AcrR family transcriptional regulator, regulator of cefoperazone and chloramphenicol sensitivity
MAVQDRNTRRRVLEAAAHLFADRGFDRVTVREICARAHANVAAVNYHFRDKRGLQNEVLAMAIGVMRATNEAARLAARSAAPGDRLGAYLRVCLEQLSGHGARTWLHRLISRELSDPTPALDAIVDQAIVPRIDDLCALVGEVLGRRPTDETVRRCVLSIHAQCLLALPNPIADRLAARSRRARPDVGQLAEHITNFSLAGIRAVAGDAPR